MKTLFLTLVIVSILSRPSVSVLAADATPDHPNVIIILSDDEGYADVGYQGCKDIPTPHIDSLASSAVRFTNGYVSCPVCSPTRAGLATGRYQQRFGHELNPGPGGFTVTFGLPLDQITLADRMKAAGYATGAIGKWHLGSEEKFNPLHRGFDEWFGFPGGAHDYFNNLSDSNNPIRRGFKSVKEDEYLTDAFSREAASFVKKNADKPFFLYLAYNAVHAPLQAPPKYMDRFPGITDKRRKSHAAQLSALDDGVGQVIDAVHEKGLDRKTLIFYLADNGGPTPSTTSSNVPLRGFKGQVYEGGFRVPFLVRWTGHLPENKTYDQPVISLDIFPTALAAAGGSIPQDRKIDGVNLLPYLKGEKTKPPHEALFWRFGAQDAVRKGDWKLVRFQTGEQGEKAHKTELYNLADDISEAKDLAQINRDKVQELTQALESWESELIDPLWSGKPRFQPGGKAAATRPAQNPARRREARRARRQQNAQTEQK